MTDFNTYKKDACKVIAGVSEPVSLNDVERKAYVTHLGDTGNNRNLTELEKQFFKSLTPVPLTGSHNDVVGKVAKNYSGNSDGSYNDGLKAFWQDVAENGLEADRIRYRYNFDGVDDFITIPEVELGPNEGIEFWFTNIDNGLSQTFVNSNTETTNQLFPAVQLDGTLTTGGALVWIDGVQVFDGEQVGFSATPRHIRIQRNGNANRRFFGVIGANWNAGGGAPAGAHFSGSIWDISVENVASGARFYPIDDGWANNPVIRDTVSGQDGTAGNFEESNWEVVNWE